MLEIAGDIWVIQGSHCKYYYWHESAACLPTKIHINSKWALAANLVNILAAASITILYLSDILISPGGGSQLSDITTGRLSLSHTTARVCVLSVLGHWVFSRKYPGWSGDNFILIYFAQEIV